MKGGDNPQSKYDSIPDNSKRSMLLGKSPRSGNDKNRMPSLGTGSENVTSTLNNDQDKDLMNSSCKDTMKMADRREFSFIENFPNNKLNTRHVGDA